MFLSCYYYFYTICITYIVGISHYNLKIQWVFVQCRNYAQTMWPTSSNLCSFILNSWALSWLCIISQGCWNWRESVEKRAWKDKKEKRKMQRKRNRLQIEVCYIEKLRSRSRSAILFDRGRGPDYWRPRSRFAVLANHADRGLSWMRTRSKANISSSQKKKKEKKKTQWARAWIHQTNQVNSNSSLITLLIKKNPSSFKMYRYRYIQHRRRNRNTFISNEHNQNEFTHAKIAVITNPLF